MTERAPLLCRILGHKWVPWEYHYTAGRSVHWKCCKRCGFVPDVAEVLTAMSKGIRHTEQKGASE